MYTVSNVCTLYLTYVHCVHLVALTVSNICTVCLMRAYYYREDRVHVGVYDLHSGGYGLHNNHHRASQVGYSAISSWNYIPHSFIQSTIHTFSHIPIHSVIPPCIQLFIHLFSHSSMHSVIHPFVQSFIHLFSHSSSH